MNTNAVIIPPEASQMLTNDIRGLKPLADVAGSMAWLWWLLLVLVLLVGGFLLLRRLLRQPATSPSTPVTPPHVLARQQLEQALSLISDPKAFCTAVSDAIRRYLELRFDCHAPDRTTEEFLFELQEAYFLLPDQKESLGAFLQGCDLVKFARMEPTETALRDLHASAGRLVDETEPDTLPSLTKPAAPPASQISGSESSAVMPDPAAPESEPGSEPEPRTEAERP